ncbi:hypothetical protein AB0E99_22720 [Streptomyces sp. NPDC030592]|uniref:hypothetical protein n=1 Tax=Streptomyces sp. NPDC030592 TaxID=3155365 RepID=UPI00340A2438
MTISLPFSAVGALLIGAAVIGYCTGRFHLRQLWAGLSLGNAACLVAELLSDNRVMAGFSTGAVAVGVWMWWISGGGDGTRRRLRDLARRFQGVRRTAPAGGTA